MLTFLKTKNLVRVVCSLLLFSVLVTPQYIALAAANVGDIDVGVIYEGYLQPKPGYENFGPRKVQIDTSKILDIMGGKPYANDIQGLPVPGTPPAGYSQYPEQIWNYEQPLVLKSPKGGTITVDPNNPGSIIDASTGQVLVPTDANGNGTGPITDTKPSPRNETIKCIDWTLDIDPWGCAAMVSYVILVASSWVLWLSGIFFNAVIEYTLNIKDFIAKMPIVDLGWTTFRDFANLFFIFILLYIAINTIVGNSSYGIKKTIGGVIMAAILINFSLFFTQLMIDASNILALQFYGQITQDSENLLGKTGSTKSLSDKDAGISAAFVNAMGLQSIYGTGQKVAQSPTGENAFDTQNAPAGLNSRNLFIVSLFGSVFILITSFVFFAGAFMFLIRTIVLIFLMILSPFAFLGSALPSIRKYTGEWWNKLTSNLIFAPAYMALLYLVVSMVLKGDFRNGRDFYQLFDGNVSGLQTLFTFVVLNSLMVGCLIVASKLGAAGSSWAESTGRGLLGKSTFGAVGFLGRNTIGRAASRIAQTEGMQKFAGRNMLGSGLMKSLRGVAGTSFDGRNLGIKGVGKAQEGGYTKSLETRAKANEEYGKSLGKGKAAYANRIGRGLTGGGGILGTFERAGRMAGASLAMSAFDDKIKDMGEEIEEYKKNPDVKEFLALVKKKRNSGLSTSENAKLISLKRILTDPARSKVEYEDETGRKVETTLVNAGTDEFVGDEMFRVREKIKQKKKRLGYKGVVNSKGTGQYNAS